MQVILSTYIDIIIIKTFLIDSILIIEEYFNIVYINNKHLFFFFANYILERSTNLFLVTFPLVGKSVFLTQIQI